jgi:two-component system LytT family response regulator
MPPERPIRVLIVDDEPLARLRIEDLLQEMAGFEVVGVADNGITAVDAIHHLRPDLVFLDVQMPRKTGVEVVREIGAPNMPATIFVTAYDQFAIQAFNVAAVDYLIKPFDDERFEEAVRRAKRRFAQEGMELLRQQLLTVLQCQPLPTGSARAMARRFILSYRENDNPTPRSWSCVCGSTR